MIPILAICTLGLAVYSNSFFCSFHFDDFLFIVNNPDIKDLSDLGAIWSVWPTRFLTVFSLAVNYHLHQLAVGGYHLFNLALHIGTAVLVWRLILLTFNTPGMRGNVLSPYAEEISLFTAFIFVAHPMQTEAVVYIWQRSVLLEAFFCLATVILYVRSRLTTQGGFFYKCSLITALLALLSKETAMSLPLMLVLYEFCFLKDKGGFPWKRLAPFFIFIIGLLILMIFAQPANVQVKNSYFLHLLGNGTLFNSYFLTQCKVWLTYLRLLCVPLGQNMYYDYPLVQSWFDPVMLAALLFLTALAVLAFKIRPGYLLVSFGILWFYAALLADSSFLPLQDVICEYRPYLALVGYALGVVGLLYHVFAGCRPWLVRAVLVLAVGWYAVLTYQRNFVWQDELSLWKDVVSKSPGNKMAHNNLGTIYRDSGKVDKAMAEFNTAIAIDPHFAGAYVNRGVIYQMKGQVQKALVDYDMAIRLAPDIPSAYNDRGLLYLDQGELDKALADFNKSLEFTPSLAYYNRGLIYLKQGRSDLALEDFTKTIAVVSSYAPAYDKRGQIYLDRKQWDLARADFEKAIAFDPIHTDAYNDLAVLDYLRGRYDQSWEDVHRAQAAGAVLVPEFLNVLKKVSAREN
jgi:tetratricopeptide (TPR) repeat protein